MSNFHLMDGLDLAVVGSGFGGLTAAALAARSGMRVGVFEQHTRPGGCAGDFALEGYWFPAGATVVTGLERGGILRRVLDTVGASIEADELDPSIVFHLGGQDVPYVTDHEAWAATFRDAFPSAPGGYLRFWEWTHTLGGAVYNIGAALPSLPIERWADLRRTLRAASPSALRTVPLLWQTVGQVKRRLGATGHVGADALIDSLLLDATGARAEECSAAQGAIALDLYRRGCQWVEGGTGRIAMQLVQSIRENGGLVRFGARVSGLDRGGDGWDVTLDRGERIRARRVIANVPPAALATLRGQRPALPAAGRAWGAFVLHIGLDGSGLGEVHPFHQVVREGEGSLDGEGESCLVSIYRGRGARADRWSVSVSTHTNVDGWRAEQAQCRRERLEARLLEAAAVVIPDLSARARMVRSATPVTYERFTGRPGGFVGGLVQRRGNTVFRAPGHRPERHLYLAGDHVFPGQGTVGTALSGINAYRDAAESLGMRPLL